uniref:Uncharacterized protein n=1 Tax=Setaria viridis TaxID=4556 RepID=A0A4U6WM06_SETVI|nr:hypothetical protein SEVIR_1G182701v2 [Setaria viridis]
MVAGEVASSIELGESAESILRSWLAAHWRAATASGRTLSRTHLAARSPSRAAAAGLVLLRRCHAPTGDRCS